MESSTRKRSQFNIFTMSNNPFKRKYIEFAQNLSKKSAEGHAEVVAGKSADVFADKPFTAEFSGVYKVAQVGQSIAQVVTFLTTAALGVFALQHVIPLSWGIYIAVPLGLLFAFGIEKVKRSTLAIAAKHFLKYKDFGFVGVVAILTLLVSIGAALYGAKELPGVVYPKPGRAVDGAAVVALTADIDRVQADIDRVQADLKNSPNWVAQNKTLPKLQAQRAALIDKREAATGSAEWRADSQHNDALAERQEKVDKMQVYAIGAAIVAELIFALCTAFVFYYLFRHYAEQHPEEPEGQQEAPQAPQAPGVRLNTPTPAAMNGRAVAQNLRADTGGVRYSMRATPAPARDNALRNDDALSNTHVIEVDTSLKPCAWCNTPFKPKTTWQKYCTTECKLSENESRHGTRFDPGKAKFKKKSPA